MKHPRRYDYKIPLRYKTTLNILEKVYQAVSPYRYQGAEKEGKVDVLVLNFTKVVSDCRAILLLSKHGLHIQSWNYRTKHE